jgi:hypothetical protein
MSKLHNLTASYVVYENKSIAYRGARRLRSFPDIDRAILWAIDLKLDDTIADFYVRWELCRGTNASPIKFSVVWSTYDLSKKYGDMK